jgi:cytoplasmic iron level regulating protein YaaA (DUF328/UPF0246 family)
VLTVLSPAKKLDWDTPIPDLASSAPALEKDIAVLAKQAKRLSAKRLKKLMGISDNLAALNYQRFQDFTLPATAESSRPAVFAFAGDTYVGLDASQLDEGDLHFAQGQLRILSGLYGLLRPMDLLQPYRLEMGAKLRNTRGKNLYDFWGSRITDELNESLSGHEDKTLVNLASVEYFKSVRPADLPGEVITPVFLDTKGGKSRSLFLFVKRARGMMARFAIKERLAGPEGLKDFSYGGYRFRAEQSDATRWVFERPQPPPVG